MLLYADGFDDYNTATSIYEWNGGLTIVNTGGRNGGGYNQVIYTQSYIAFDNSDLTTVWGGACRFPGGLGGTTAMMHFTDNLLRDVGYLFIDAAGRLGWYSNVTNTVMGMSSPVINFNGTTWYFVEIKKHLNSGSSGTIAIHLNEDPILTLSGLHTGFDSVSPIIIATKSIGYVWGFDLDDEYMCNTQGTECNDFLGDCKSYFIQPNGAGANTDFTPYGSGNNFANVNEQYFDGGTTYNESDVIGAKDTFVYAALPAGVHTALAVVVKTMAGKTAASTRRYRNILLLGGTQYDGAEKYLGTGYAKWFDTWQLNPHTGVGWVVADFLAANFEQGYELTG